MVVEEIINLFLSNDIIEPKHLPSAVTHIMGSSARDKMKDWEANAKFELPQSDIIVEFFPSKEDVFRN